jgi:membrane-associated phospholipid phosphatase
LARIKYWQNGRSILLQAAVLTLACTPAGYAQGTVDVILQDAKLYVTAPVRWDRSDWLFAGGSLLAIAAAQSYDNQVRQSFADSAPINKQDTHSTQDALPAAVVVAGTWALAYLWDDRDGYRETRNMLEAGALSAASALVLKQLLRRERPSDTNNSHTWFKGGDSFPSLHVSAAMAIGAVLAESGNEENRWIRRGLGYGLGVATGYARLKHQQHWLSDTVAGAALGIATARFVLNQHRPGTAYSSLLLVPAEGGLMLSYNASF